jgi:hydrogenase maturation protease
MKADDQTTDSQGRSIIIGLGNSLLSDDAVGPLVARRVHALLDSPGLEFCELAAGGVELMETLIGYRGAVIIDAILTESGTPGTCYLLELERCPPTRHASMSHGIGLLEGLELARRLCLEVPDFVRIYAVKVVDPFTFGTKMTNRVERAIPRIARKIASEVRTPLCGASGLIQVQEERRPIVDSREVSTRWQHFRHFVRTPRIRRIRV